MARLEAPRAQAVSVPDNVAACPLWADYKQALADPFGPAMCFVRPSRPRCDGPHLMSVDVIDYGARKCLNTVLTFGVLGLTAPIVGALGLPFRVCQLVPWWHAFLLAPMALGLGLAAGCVSSAVNIVVRSFGACFGVAAVLMGAACLPIDVTGSALEQLARAVG